MMQNRDLADRSIGYMFDTTEFNALADGVLPFGAIEGLQIFITHVQRDELSATGGDQRRTDLLLAFETIAAQSLPTESFVWDVSRWDHAKWPAEDSQFTKMLSRLQELDAPKRKDVKNQLRDILIAETAVRNGMTLVTGDENLKTVTLEFGGLAIDRNSMFREPS
jgi:hypothetical protein